MTDAERAKEWARHIMVGCSDPGTRIKVLISRDEKMRQLVLEEMECRTALELVERIAE